MRIVDAVTNRVVDDLPWFDAAPYRRPGKNVFAITKTIKLDQLKKGDYLVESQAKDSAGRTTPWRTAEFSVK